MKLNRPESEIEQIFSTTELAGNIPARHQNLYRERKDRKKNMEKHHVASLTTSLIISLQGGKLSSSTSVKSTYQ